MTEFNIKKAEKRSGYFLTLIAVVTVILYFDIVNHYWFIKLSGGFLIKIWIPPLLLFLFVLIRMMVKKENIFSISKINLFLLFYAISGIVAMLLNEPLNFAIKYYLIMIAPVWFYVVISETIRDNKDIELLIKVLFFCGLGFCLQTISYGLQSKESSLVQEEFVSSAGNAISFGGDPIFRVKDEGTEGTYTTLSRGVLNVEHSNYCGMLTPLFLFGIMYYMRSKGKDKFIYLGGSFLMLSQIIDTNSRSGIATVLVGIFILFWCLYRYEKTERVKIVIMLTLGVTAVVVYLIAFSKWMLFIRFLGFFTMVELPPFLREYQYLLQFSDAVDPHIATMGESFNTFLASPLFGSGFVFKGEEDQELNRYLFILASAGVFTFISYVLFFGGLIVSTRKTMLNFKPLKSHELNYGYLFFAFGIAFLFKLNNQGQELFYYWIVFALASAWIRNCKREQFAIRRIL